MESLRVSRFLNLGCRTAKKEDLPEEWKRNYDSPGVDFNVPNNCNCLDMDGKKALAAYGDASKGCGTKKDNTSWIKSCGGFLEEPGGGPDTTTRFCDLGLGKQINYTKKSYARSMNRPEPKNLESQCYPPGAFVYDSDKIYLNKEWERYDEICEYGHFAGCPTGAQPSDKAVAGTTNFLNQDVDTYWNKNSKFWAQSVQDREKEIGTKQIP